MTPVLAKAVLVLLAIAWYVIRYPYERRARRNPVARTERGPREYLLMAISAAGFGLFPSSTSASVSRARLTIRFTRLRLGLAFWSPLARSSCFA